jgi:hypothetical protein
MTAKKCRDFSAEEVVRATVSDSAIRASDSLTGVSASSTAAVARDRVEGFAETAVEISNRRYYARGDDVGMEATQSDWILVRCACRLVESAATIVACSTRAHRRLCATVLRVPMGCARVAMLATNMAEPAQQAASSKICSISITAFAADPTSRCCAGFVYGFPAGCRVPTPGAANV